MSKTKDFLHRKITQEIIDWADEPIFDNPKQEIDELISLAKENGIDFWQIVKSNCSLYELTRLQYLYEGKDLQDLDEKTFGKPKKQEFKEFFPERSGKQLISLQQAFKLFAENKDLKAEHYYTIAVGKSTDDYKMTGAILSTHKQKMFIETSAKSKDKYTFIAAITKEEFEKIAPDQRSKI